jgi:hypothetical protein
LENPSFFAADLEPALLQQPDGGDVVVGGAGIEGTLLYLTQEPAECPRGDAPAPVALPDPVAHLPLAGALEAQYVAGHAPVEEYGHFRDGSVGQDPLPARHESVPVRRVLGREGGHTVCLRVVLLVEEYGEVLFGHIP